MGGTEADGRVRRSTIAVFLFEVGAGIALAALLGSLHMRVSHRLSDLDEQQTTRVS